MHLSCYKYLKVLGALGDALPGRQLEEGPPAAAGPAHFSVSALDVKRLQSNPEEIAT